MNTPELGALPKEEFFAAQREQGLALTYDDVRLYPGASTVPAREVEIASRFSIGVELKIPIVTAAMDTITGRKMATTMARLGGLGVINAGLSIDEQAEAVRRTKVYLNGRVDEPQCMRPEMTVQDVLAEVEKNDWHFHTFPVTDTSGQFLGMLTSSDLLFAHAGDRVERAMTPASDVRVGDETTTGEEAYIIMHGIKKKTLPVLSDGKVTGLYLAGDLKRINEEKNGMNNVDSNNRLFTAAAVPTNEEALERIAAMQGHLDVAVIDTARGDSRFAVETLDAIKNAYPELQVVVGNISVPESALLLARHRADGIKVGQGGGSICSTRTQTGIGNPQLTAVYECAKALSVNGFEDLPVTADGGIVNPGDFSIALAAGAGSIMVGRIVAGTEETPVEMQIVDGKRVAEYTGMGSAVAKLRSAAARSRYSSAGLEEGVSVLVEYRGPVAPIIREYELALRASMEYTGTVSVSDFQKRSRYQRITSSGLRESHPHDV